MWRSSRGKALKILFSTSRQEVMSGDFLGSRTSAYVMVALEGKHCKNNECPPFLFLFLSFYIWAYVIWYGISLCAVCVSCPGYVLSQDFAHPKPAGVGGNVGKTAWMLWEHCSAVAKMLCSQWLPSYCYKAQALRATEGRMSSASARPNAWKQWKVLLINGLSSVWFQGFPSSFWVGHFKNECWGSFGVHVCMVIFLLVIYDPFFLQEIWFL